MGHSDAFFRQQPAPAGALRHSRRGVRGAAARAHRPVLQPRRRQGRARPGAGLEGDRRQQAHHPARDRAVLRARPGAADRARGLHPHADGAQRPAPAVPADAGLGAPRTTRTQEGLATFAEIITGAIDISRLRRIALRVRDGEAGAGRRRLHRRVPRLPRGGPERSRELPQRRARVPRRRRARQGAASPRTARTWKA